MQEDFAGKDNRAREAKNKKLGAKSEKNR